MKYRILLLCVVIASGLGAQWSYDVSVNTVIASGEGNQECNLYVDMPGVYSVAETSTGTVVAWHFEDAGNYDIYAQKIDSRGYFQWGETGIAVCTDPGEQRFPNVVADGDGGVLVFWMDKESGDADVYAQKVNSDGTLAWASKKVVINGTGNHYYPVACSDGTGGAIISWAFQNTDYDIYAQRMDNDGNLLWGAAQLVCGYTGNQLYPVMIPDDSGGALLAWHDYRNSASTLCDIYGQRISSAGGLHWSSNGVAICNYGQDQTDPIIAPDGSGGMYVTWNDDVHRSYDIYLQRVYSDGSKWATPTAIAEDAAEDYWPSLDNNGSSGAFISWWVNMGSGGDIVKVAYVQSDGTLIYTTSCSTDYSEDKLSPYLVSDDMGHAYVCWRDYRPGGTVVNIWGQKLDTFGNLLWDPLGVEFSSAAMFQVDPFLFLNDDGRPVCFWHVGNTGYRDIYCQALSVNGVPPLVVSEPIPMTGSYVIEEAGLSLDFSILDGSGDVYVLRLEEEAAGLGISDPAPVWWNIEEDDGISAFTADLSFDYAPYLGSLEEANLKLFFNDGSGWQEYPNTAVDTVNDIITALGTTHFSDWTFGEDEESTLPVTLSSFTATPSISNGIQLQWTTASETEMAGYYILRAETETPSLALVLNENIIAASNSAVGHSYLFLDQELEQNYLYYYWLQSVSQNGITHLYGPVAAQYSSPEDPEIPEAGIKPGIISAYPNPFNPMVNLSFFLEMAGLCRLSIYNSRGQMVRSFQVEAHNGVNHLHWDGKDELGNSLSSGVYQIVLKARDLENSIKCTLMK